MTTEGLGSHKIQARSDPVMSTKNELNGSETMERDETFRSSLSVPWRYKWQAFNLALLSIYIPPTGSHFLILRQVIGILMLQVMPSE